MKCDSCGKEEVNYHYTSNINGNITEKHLCSDCAAKMGAEGGAGIFGAAQQQPDVSFEEIFTDLFGMRPNRRMLGGYSMMIPTFVIPTLGIVVQNGAVSPAADEPRIERPSEVSVEVDGEMKKRRELNILREQMRRAAEAEDYEKAAALRDDIRKLEIGENS